MRRPELSRSYRSDHKKLLRSGCYDMERLQDVVRSLALDIPLSPQHSDHELSGEWIGFRECHVSFDWLLIYKKQADVLYLARTGTHSDLFKK
ncbi:addiction module toxin, RelE/StbE family [Synergistales bacterium]|nr:addiction module toxin, RelE/StbE family [Synergistales bacterium]